MPVSLFPPMRFYASKTGFHAGNTSNIAEGHATTGEKTAIMIMQEGGGCFPTDKGYPLYLQIILSERGWK